MAAWRDQAAAGVILAFQAGEAAAAAARWTAAELPMVQAVRDEPLGQRQSMESVPMGRRRRYVEVVANRARLLATDVGTVLAGGRARDTSGEFSRDGVTWEPDLPLTCTRVR